MNKNFLNNLPIILQHWLHPTQYQQQQQNRERRKAKKGLGIYGKENYEKLCKDMTKLSYTDASV